MGKANIDEEMMIESDQSDSKRSNYHIENVELENDTVLLGNSRVPKKELIEVFRNILGPQISLGQPQQGPGLANPTPIALCAFALTTFVLSLVNVRARGVTVANIHVGLSYFYGGIVQMLAGMWNVAYGDTLMATAFSSYGAFWMSFAAINTDAMGIISAYGDDTEMLGNALGFFLLGWFIFTTILAICTLRTTVTVFGLLFLVALLFLVLAVANITGSVALTKAGGWIGLAAAFDAWYIAAMMIATKDNTFLVLKDYPMPFSSKKNQ